MVLGKFFWKHNEEKKIPHLMDWEKNLQTESIGVLSFEEI